MQNLVNLYNQALTAVGHAADVTDPEMNSKSANLCRLWYAPTRRAILSAAYWPSARRIQRLALVASRPDTEELWLDGQPWPGYGYSYTLPNDCLRPQFMVDYSHFQLGNTAGAKVVMSNNPAPILAYTIDDAAPENWEPYLYEAMIFGLAARINMAKSGKMVNTRELLNMTNSYITTAAVAVANEDDTYFEAIPGHWAGTGFSVPNLQSQYFYPTQAFLLTGV